MGYTQMYVCFEYKALCFLSIISFWKFPRCEKIDRVTLAIIIMPWLHGAYIRTCTYVHPRSLVFDPLKSGRVVLCCSTEPLNQIKIH